MEPTDSKPQGEAAEWRIAEGLDRWSPTMRTHAESGDRGPAWPNCSTHPGILCGLLIVTGSTTRYATRAGAGARVVAARLGDESFLLT
jgi:hypothetical protein